MRESTGYRVFITALFLYCMESLVARLIICAFPSVPNSGSFSLFLLILAVDLGVAIFVVRKIDLSSKSFGVKRIVLFEVLTVFTIWFQSTAPTDFFPCRRGQAPESVEEVDGFIQ